MSAPEKTSHWKSLADQLGAPPPEEGVSPEGSGMAATSMPAPAPLNAPSIAAPRQATIRQAKADWEALASVLGLASKAPAEVEAKVESAPAVSEREQPASYEPPPVSAERSPPVWTAPLDDMLEPVDPLEMTTEPFVDEIVDAVELDMTTESDMESESDVDADTEPASDERRRRRRRRRRRGRRPDDERRGGSAEREVGTEPDEEPEADAVEARGYDADEELEPDVERDEDRDDEPEARDADEERGEDERRPRRRRRRRRRGGRRDEAPRKSEPAAAAPPHDDDADDDKTIADILGEDEHDEDDERGELHLSHKKIPSWQEAIEVVVSNNMAQRSKYPSGGSRGRGRRDR